MDTRIIDLHVHSNASDGTFSPTDLAAEAKKAGLSAFALTDHDTTAGIAEASLAAEAMGIELVPGVELSTEYEGKEIHVVGLFIDPENAAMQMHIKAFRDSRDNRNIYMLENLRNTGFDITLDALDAAFPDAVITRAHIARYLLDTKQIPDMKTAFEKYIGDDCPCYVPRPKVTPTDAVDYIRDAGGIAILAHPVIYHLERARLRHLITDMKAHGLTGMEAIYSENTPADETDLKELASEMGLLVSGGSDFHGSNKPHIKLGIGRGSLHIPYSVLEKLKASREQ